jgi:hypothetical protein
MLDLGEGLSAGFNIGSLVDKGVGSFVAIARDFSINTYVGLGEGLSVVSLSAPMLVWEKVHQWASWLDHWWMKELAHPLGQGGILRWHLCWFRRRFVGGLQPWIISGQRSWLLRGDRAGFLHRHPC